MSFDEHDLRRALEARSGEPSPDLRSRLRQAVTRAPRGAAGGDSWLAAVAVIVVTVLTATSVGVLVAGRHARNAGSASGARVASPSPPSTGPASNVQLSAPLKGFVWALVDYKALYVSTDGGDHWSQRTLPDNPGIKPSISFLSDSWGWLLAPGSPTTQCQQANAFVWRTTDGARTWHRLAASGIVDAQCKDGIHFTDADHGFMTAWDDNHHSTVYVSTDQGMTWRKSTLPDNPLFVTSPGGFVLRVGWIKGFGNDFYLEASGPQHDPIYPRDFIYTSTDGGATWTWKQKLGSPYTYMVTELRWLQLAPDVMESVNGGQAFAPYVTDLKVTPPFKAYFVNVFLGYVVAGTEVQRTVDGGAHWTPVSTPWNPFAVASPSPTPSQIPMPTEVQLSAPSANIVWALVAHFRLFVSLDGGRSWQERSTPKAPPGSEASQISFVDNTNGWMSTCANTTTLLWKTVDGAKTWRTVSSPFPPDQCLLGLSFVDRSHGFITESFDYAPPAIYSTPDGGETWNGSTLRNPPAYEPGQPGYAFEVVRIVRFGTSYLLAARGAVPGGITAWVFRSTDGGAIFTYVGSLPYPPDSLAFVTATRWVIIGNDGSGHETIDAGSSWHTWTTDYRDAAGVASTFIFADSMVGYGTVRGGVRRTLDGGAHWELIKTSWP